MVLVIIALLCGGMYVSRRNQMVTLNESVKLRLGAGGCRPPAPLGPDSESRRNGEGFCGAGTDRVRRYRQGALPHWAARRPRKDKIAANGQLDGALSRLLLIVENYPQLKSNENFLRLQDELAGTENRIAVERKRYDDAIQAYNTFILQFPNNIIAGMAGFTRNDAYFAATPKLRARCRRFNFHLRTGNRQKRAALVPFRGLGTSVHPHLPGDCAPARIVWRGPPF